VVVHAVTSTFVASGDVSEYDASTQAKIALTVASAANVVVDAVSVSVAAASVRVTVQIAFADPATARATALALSGIPSAGAPSVQPIFQSATSLNAAMSFITVAAVTSAPEYGPLDGTPPPPPFVYASGNTDDAGAIAGAALGSILGFALVAAGVWGAATGKLPMPKASAPSGAYSVAVTAPPQSVPEDVAQEVAGARGAVRTEQV